MTRQKTRMDSNSPGIWDEIAGEKPFGLMGILNLTPDSFYDGGRLQSVQCALAHVEKLLNSGTDILDLGAESTRPGSASLPPHMEKNRLLPVFLAIRNEFPDAIISVDTWHAETARFFLANGAAIINDVSACFWDEALGEVLADAKPGYVLMHSQGRPSFMQKMPLYKNVVDEVRAFFQLALDRLASFGLPEKNIVLDPGIGFGKNLAHNLALMANMDVFLEFGRPLLAGISMKSWLGNLLDMGLNERSNPTATASALLWQKGVFWHRIHEPWVVRPALELACALDGTRNMH